MKQTLYSKILLVITGGLLITAAVLLYAAAFRIFPIYSFMLGADAKDCLYLIERLSVPITALTLAFLLLLYLYRHLTVMSAVLCALYAILPWLGQMLIEHTDLAGRYLFPALAFLIIPFACMSALRSFLPKRQTRAGLIFQAVFGCLLLFLLLLSSTAALFTNDLLFYILLLILAPFLPLVTSLFLLTNGNGLLIPALPCLATLSPLILLTWLMGTHIYSLEINTYLARIGFVLITAFFLGYILKKLLAQANEGA